MTTASTIVSASSYLPSFVEVGITLGLVALGVLLFLIATRLLALTDSSISK